MKNLALKQARKVLKENMPTLLILALAGVFLLIGIGRGEGQTVYRKAANLCMECIGLG